MKLMHKLTNQQFACSAARVAKWICYFAICFSVFSALLSFMGRQTFSLHTESGVFENAIYAEQDHAPHSRGLTVSLGDDIHVWADGDGQIGLPAHMALSFLYAVHTAPMAAAFWLLGRVFSNIQNGEIFSDRNSSYLLYYGLLQFSAAAVVPLIKLLVCWLFSLASVNRLSLSTGQAAPSMLVSCAGFVVAAYIIHYGVHLQDEVDHTL